MGTFKVRVGVSNDNGGARHWVDAMVLGATAPQVFGLIADTTNHRLIPAPTLPI